MIISDSQLIMELARRAQSRRHGICDHCGRSGDSEPCREKRSHDQALNRQPFADDDRGALQSLARSLPATSMPMTAAAAKRVKAG